MHTIPSPNYLTPQKEHNDEKVSKHREDNSGTNSTTTELLSIVAKSPNLAITHTNSSDEGKQNGYGDKLDEDLITSWNDTD